MTQTKHTPGPWLLPCTRPEKDYDLHPHLSQHGNKVILNGSKNPECDLHLIAAAPELLDAIEYIFSPGQPLLTRLGIEKLQKAVLKARGE